MATFWHGSLDKIEIGSFRPLSHFGTLTAAQERLRIKRSVHRQPPIGWLMECEIDLRNPLEIRDNEFEHNCIDLMYEVCEAASVSARVAGGLLEGFHKSPRHLPNFSVGDFLIPGEHFSPDELAITPDTAWRSVTDSVLADCFGQKAVTHARTVTVELLSKLGHDGMVYLNSVEDKGETSVIVADTARIVSVRPHPADGIELEPVSQSPAI